jgi:hypothetical protein
MALAAKRNESESVIMKKLAKTSGNEAKLAKKLARSCRSYLIWLPESIYEM